MGKWTASHYDEVLNAKIKSLVSGAITRSRLEKTDPLVTYESFVEQLDAGDSFTTSLVEILVKEVADRLTRNTITDRRLIADRTAKGLRQLAAPGRIHHRRYARRSATLTPDRYVPGPPGEMVMEEDDEFDSLLDGQVEGARMNSDLYEAYGNQPAWASAVFHSRTVSPSSEPGSPRPSDSPPNPPAAHTSSLSRILSNSSGSTSLQRQPSIRHAARRTRTVDFNEFSARRRSSYRDSVPADEPGQNDSRDRASQRRFFHFPRNTSRYEASWSSPWTDENDEMRAFPLVESSSSSAPGAWIYPMPLTPTLSRESTDNETTDDRATAQPRLRRGGVRAPESMLSRHASPVRTAPNETAYPTPGPGEAETENTTS
ncbi:hypothetical protein C8J56DRAFT_935798 [Mycena floridula]|nr:hypothetical protein C8J56DRAFT_935798 [Mycena floridula]